MSADHLDADESAEPRAADGRVPGRRGRATRQRLLECTGQMLKDRTYRDLKVVDIAREAGTSPATFYQYFPDVESAILVLADYMVAQGSETFSALTAKASWKGRAGYEASLDLVDGVLVAMLANVAAHRYGFEFWGIRTDDTLRAMTRIVYSAMTGQKPPAA